MRTHTHTHTHTTHTHNTHTHNTHTNTHTHNTHTIGVVIIESSIHARWSLCIQELSTVASYLCTKNVV